MPLFAVETEDGRKFTIDADRQPTPQEASKAIGSMPNPVAQPKPPGNLETFGEHAATGIAPGAAFAAGSVPGIKAGAAIGAAIPGLGETGIPEAVGAFLGGLVTGGIASWAAYKAQHAALEKIAPKFTAEMDKRLQTGASAHPFAAVAGDVAANLPSMEASIPKLSQVPFRAALGATVGGVMPLAQGRKPTAQDIATGAIMATTLGRSRFEPRNPLPMTTKAAAEAIQKGAENASQVSPSAEIHGNVRAFQEPTGQLPIKESGAGVQPQSKEEKGQVGQQTPLPLTPEHKALIDQTAAANGQRVVYRTPASQDEPFARQMAMIDRATGETVVNPVQTGQWLARDIPVSDASKAVASMLSEERIHHAVSDEDALAYLNSLTAPERAIAQRVYAGPNGAPLSPVLLGHEALRIRMQQLARMDVRETIDASRKERWTVKSLLALGNAIRGVREAIGTDASKEGLAIIDRIQGNLDAAIKARSGQEPGASSKEDKEEYAKVQAEMKALDMSQPDFDSKFESIVGRMEEIKNRNKGYAPGTEPEEPAAMRKGKEDERGFEVGNYWIDQNGAITGRPSAHHEEIASEILKSPRPSTNDELLEAARSNELFLRKWARVVNERDRILVESSELSDAQRRELVNRAIETKKALLWDRQQGKRDEILYEPENPAAIRKRSDEGQQEFLLPPINQGETRPTATEAARAEKEPLTADQIDSKKEGAYQRVPGAMLNDQFSYKLGRFLTDKAAKSNNATRTATRRLTVLQKPGQDSVTAVSAYRDPGTGLAMLAHPDLSPDRERIHRPLRELLAAGYKPVASVLLKEPVTNYRRMFPSLEAFENATGFPKARAANVAPQTGFEAEKLVPITQPSHPEDEYVGEEARKTVFDHFAKANTFGEAVAGINRLPKAQLRTVHGVLKKALDMMGDMNAEQRETAMLDFLRKIYDHAKQKDIAGFLGDFEPPERAAIAQAHGQGQPGVGEEIPDSEGERGPSAINKHAVEEAKLIADDIKGVVRGAKTEDAVARAYDSATNTPHILAEQAANNVRLASAERPKDTFKAALTQWKRGNKQVLAAANALVQSGAVRENGSIDMQARNKLPLFQAKVAKGRSAAIALTQSGSWRAARLGRAWIRAADELKAELDYAEAHWNDLNLQETARRMAKNLREQYSRERAAGIDVSEKSGYDPQRYDAALWNEHSILFGQPPKILGRNWAASTFPTYYDAIEAGPYLPVTRDGASLVGHRVRQGESRIYRSQWVDGLKGVNMPDGRPMAVNAKLVALPSGGHQWQSPATDYHYLDMGGKGIAVHDDFIHLIKNLSAKSEVDNWPKIKKVLELEQALKHTMLVGDFFHMGRTLYYGLSLMGKNAGWKGGWSVLDIHPQDLNEAVVKGIIRPEDAAWGREQVPFGKSTISRRELAQKFYREAGANLGKIQDALYKDLITDSTPSTGPVMRGIKRLIDPSVGRYNRFLFDNLTRGMMAEANVREFERQMKAMPNANPEAVMRDISRDVNNYFGNVGKQGWAKSATMKDLQRMIALAPDWLEGLVKKEWFAYQRGLGISSLAGSRKGLSTLGTTGRGIARGLVFLSGLTQAINLITRHQFTWQNDEKEHKGDAWMPWGRDGIWFSPLAVFNELTHDVWRLSETKPTVMQAIDQVAGNKESPIMRAVILSLVDSGAAGQRPTTSAGQIKQAATQLMPTPITFGRLGQAAGHAVFPNAVSAPPPGSAARSFFGAAGLKVQAAQNPVQRITGMAQDFLAKSGLKKDTGWQEISTDEPSYSKLRAALYNGNQREASKLYSALEQSHTDRQIFKAMKAWKAHPFTGSKANERKFIQSLDDRALDLYTAANQQRQQLYEQFLDFAARQQP